MAKHLMVVMLNCVEGQEAEFNRWYDEEHLPDILSTPGFVSAQRFELSPYQRRKEPARHRYFTVYEIEGDLPTVFAAMDENLKGVEYSPTMLRGPANTFSHFFTALGDRIVKKPGQDGRKKR